MLILHKISFLTFDIGCVVFSFLCIFVSAGQGQLERDRKKKNKWEGEQKSLLGVTVFWSDLFSVCLQLIPAHGLMYTWIMLC